MHHDGGLPISVFVYVGLLVLGGIGGVISWLVTRWRIAGGNLQIETGFIRRQSLRIPLARIQAVDVIAPLSGRFLGLAEVRVVSAGRGAEHGRLAYLTAAQAPVVRARLLALAHGLEVGTPEPAALPLLHVQNGLLLPALLMRAQVLAPMLIAIAAIAAIAAAPVVGARCAGQRGHRPGHQRARRCSGFQRGLRLRHQRSRRRRSPRPRPAPAASRDHPLRPHPGRPCRRAAVLAGLRVGASRGRRRQAERVSRS